VRVPRNLENNRERKEKRRERERERERERDFAKSLPLRKNPRREESTPILRLTS
jgi:hypothetical protein